MMREMSIREKRLAAAVGAIAFVLLTFFVTDYFLKSRARLQAEMAAKTRQLKSMQMLIADKTLWEQRDAWIEKTQPKLTSPDSAGVQLLEEVKQVARKQTVLLDNPAIRQAARNSQLPYASIAVEIETKSSWKSLIAFLGELQVPEKFIVFESANLKIDAADPTQMRGRFRIARWYAPK